MKAQPIDQLIFKGTHNSYECTGIAPCMNHPLDMQIDGFGVWAVELDIGITYLDPDFQRPPEVSVGENGAGDKTCFVPQATLAEYFLQIKTTLSIRYRPVLVYFDIKDWTASYDGDLGYNGVDVAAQWGISVARDVFGPANVIDLAEYVSQKGFPLVPSPEIGSGTVIIYYPLPEYAAKPPGGGTLPGVTLGGCLGLADVQGAIAGGSRVILLDLYQADWTFYYGVPPNPLVVDITAAPRSVVTDSVGDEWDCGPGRVSDKWKFQEVAEHGTFRFPYASLGAAVARAAGVTPDHVLDPRRAGYGWTVLIRPGRYREAITIDVPLTLMKDDRFDGNVVIGA